ncbi:MAG: SRPBCC domain-containing protein [Flavobacterium sp.]|uniref:SRPBCC family protein n=1 Tax=Flavobacterium sp. TaxID=239 RepID=UPI0011F69CA0|nr:SRPBCC domain-containing protein [Flavobacterium sp.]RZJ67801.1 MAG: SRPBCC domain-containing protein [Flavobacterium sp.]
MEKSQQAIVLTRTYDAPISKVWKALTEIEQMRQWYFPMLADFKPEIGFTTEFEAGPEGKPYLHRWIVTEVIENKKIAYKWLYPAIEGDSTLSFEIESVERGTKLTLTHSGLESFQANGDPNFEPGSFNGGWTHFIQAFADYIE